MDSYISGKADKGNLDRWAKYSSDKSYHEKSNGNQAPNAGQQQGPIYGARH
jgi:hypothetical protein